MTDLISEVDNLLYFHIFDKNNKEVLVCYIHEKNTYQKDLNNLHEFLAYYNQNYKLHNAINNNINDHICIDILCVRKHIIDTNIKLITHGPIV